MEKNLTENNSDKLDKELLLFDKGFNDIQEISSKKKLSSEHTKKNHVTWFTLYLKLFKNALSSKNLIPKEELKLRLNIMRKYLPSYYNAPKSNEITNSSSILKKFTYHVYSKNNLFKRLLEKHSRKKSLFIFEEEDNKEKEIVTEIKTQNFKRKDKKTKTLKLSSDDIKLFNFGESRKKKISSQNFQPQELKVIQEYSPKRSMNIFNFKSNEIQFSSGIRKENDKRDRRKRTTVRMEGAFTNKLLFNQKKKQPTNIFFYEMERKAKLKLDQKKNDKTDLENIDKDYIIRTPNDSEYSLELTDKRMMDNKRTYFYEYLNKLNIETKNEKVNTFKREVATQLLKFNELYYDSKLDDFSQDKIFGEIKHNCDFLINKFNMDKDEEKNIVDLEKFL